MRRTLQIDLSGEMYDELVDAAERTAKQDEEVCDPVAFAKELIESALADRRLERIAFASRRPPLAMPRRVVDPIVRVQL